MQHRYVFNIFVMKGTGYSLKKTISLRSSMVGVLGSIYRSAKREIFYLKDKQDNTITFNFSSKRELINLSLTILIYSIPIISLLVYRF